MALAELHDCAGAPELVVGVLITVPLDEDEEEVPVRDGVPEVPELPTVPEVPLFPDDP